MRRSTTVIVSLALVAVLSLQTSLGLGKAQEATPAGELPLGVGITPLVGAMLEELPVAPARLQVSQLILQPGAELPPSTLPGVSAVLVQAGSFTARCGSAEEGCHLQRAVPPGPGTPTSDDPLTGTMDVTVAVGDGLIVPANVPSGGRNEGNDQVVLLVIAILPGESGSMATPMA